MPGYSYQFVDPVPKRCVCPVCHLPMRAPVAVGSCGHAVCASCFDSIPHRSKDKRQCPHAHGSGSGMCPMDKLNVNREDLRKDRKLQEEVEGCMIQCPQEPQGCRWVDAVKNVESHLDSCRHVSVPCPENCGALVSRARLRDHLETTTCGYASQRRRRRSRCLHCGSHAAGIADNPANPDGEENDGADGSCGRCGGSQFAAPDASRAEPGRARRERPQRQQDKDRGGPSVNSRDKEPPPPVPRRAASAERSLEAASALTPRRPASSALPLTMPRRGSAVPGSCCPMRASGCRFRARNNRALERHAIDAAADHVTLLSGLVRAQGRELDALSRRLRMASAAATQRDGVLLWRIDSYSRRLRESKRKSIKAAHAAATDEEAEDEEEEEHCSEPFYTGRPGYLMQAAVVFSSGNNGRGHLGLYAKLLPGEFDSLLDWPLARPIRMRLLDQSGQRRHVTRGFRPEPGWPHFRRPAPAAAAAATMKVGGGGGGLGFGFPRFVSHGEMAEGGFVREDAIFLEVAVL